MPKARPKRVEKNAGLVNPQDRATEAMAWPRRAGAVPVADAREHVGRALDAAVTTLTGARDGVQEVDPASVDLLHAAILGLEKHAWLIGAEA